MSAIPTSWSRKRKKKIELAPSSLSRSLLRNLNNEEESKADLRYALLAVATIIVSATYQTMLQPPSFKANISTKGFLASYASWMNGPLCRDISYVAFISGNTFGPLLSVQMIIFLTKDHPVKKPLFLYLAAMVQTYCCYTYYPPITSLDKEFDLKSVKIVDRAAAHNFSYSSTGTEVVGGRFRFMLGLAFSA